MHTLGFGASAAAEEPSPSPDDGPAAASASLAALAASARWYGRCHGTKKSAPPSVVEAVGAVAAVECAPSALTPSELDGGEVVAARLCAMVVVVATSAAACPPSAAASSGAIRVHLLMVLAGSSCAPHHVC